MDDYHLLGACHALVVAASTWAPSNWATAVRWTIAVWAAVRWRRAAHPLHVVPLASILVATIGCVDDRGAALPVPPPAWLWLRGQWFVTTLGTAAALTPGDTVTHVVMAWLWWRLAHYALTLLPPAPRPVPLLPAQSPRDMAQSLMLFASDYPHRHTGGVVMPRQRPFGPGRRHR